jgi:hypothetical protein
MVIGAVNDGYARVRMPEMVAERQAAKACAEDNHVGHSVVRYGIVSIQPAADAMGVPGPRHQAPGRNLVWL